MTLDLIYVANLGRIELVTWYVNIIEKLGPFEFEGSWISFWSKISILPYLRQVENKMLQRDQMLGAFWEHMLAIDPIFIRDRMLFCHNQIRALKNRKEALLQEQEGLLMVVSILHDPPTGNGETGRTAAF